MLFLLALLALAFLIAAAVISIPAALVAWIVRKAVAFIVEE